MIWVGLAMATSVMEAFPPPMGAVRVDADSFGTYVQSLEVHPASRPVTTHDGRTVRHAARAIVLDLVDGDLQQCADSAIRLRAEWRHERGEPVMFHATSGDPIPWARWKSGERPYAEGRGLKWRKGTKGGWEAYLRAVFMWAGTLSLEAYDTEVAKGEPVPGDLLVKPGSPGHAVVLLDVAKDPRGRTFVLVGEGYMPAQDFHVELGPHDGWWLWDGGVELAHWDLHGSGVHRRFLR